jgi:branched-chain amino acid transport system substrate-binding protein
MSLKKISLPLLILVLFSACTQATTQPSKTDSPVQQPEATSTPTQLPAPSSTSTPIPTETPVPTSTNTPEPTSTPTITPTFSPQTLQFSPGEPLRIGYLLWEGHPMGIDSLRGIEIAIQDFGGSLLGHPIDLTGYDSECNQLAGQSGAQNLIFDDSVIGVIGTTCSPSALRAAPIISDGGSVLISPSNSLAELTAPDSRAPGYFRTAPNDVFQVNAVAHYAYEELGARRLATVHVSTRVFQRLQSEALCEAFAALGGDCVLERTMEEGSAYMDPIINSLVAAEPDAVYFMNGDFEVGAAFLEAVKSTPELEDTAIFVWEILNQPGFLDVAGDTVLGVYVSVTSYEFDQGSSAYLAFVDAYRSAYGEDPNPSLFHAFAYDAATLLLMALEQVAVQGEDGTLMVDPLAIREALYTQPGFSGLSGWIVCSKNGDCDGSPEGKVYEFVSGDPGTFNPGLSDSLSSNPVLVWP